MAKILALLWAIAVAENGGI